MIPVLAPENRLDDNYIIEYHINRYDIAYRDMRLFRRMK
jgi:hypothetical protein